MVLENELEMPTCAVSFRPGTSHGIACALSESAVRHFQSLSRFVDEIFNRTPNHAAPYVGTSAFAHKGGLHVAAMERSPLSYQHIDPARSGK